MEQRALEVTILSAKDLGNVNYIGKMNVYIIVSILGDKSTNVKTPVDVDGGSDPTWNFQTKFIIDEVAAQQNRSAIVFKVKCERALGDKDIGEVTVPIKELLQSPRAVDGMKHFVSYQVMKPDGKTKGFLNFAFQFGEKVTTELYPTVSSSTYTQSSLLSPLPPGGSYHPPPHSEGHPPPPNHSEGGVGYPSTPHYSEGYPTPPKESEGGYPPSEGYPPPPKHSGGGYPYPHSHSEGYPPSTHSGGGYPYPHLEGSQHSGGGYPPPEYHGIPPSQGGYPPPEYHGIPPWQGGYHPPPPQYGGYVHQPPSPYGGYPSPQPSPGFGFSPSHPGYAYTPHTQHPSKKNNNIGLGLGAGLLGGAVGGALGGLLNW